MKIIVTIIPTDLVTNSLLSSFCPFWQAKNKNQVFSNWWSGNEKYFCVLFKASCALLQSHAKFNTVLWRNFLTCYSCSLKPCSSVPIVNFEHVVAGWVVIAREKSCEIFDSGFFQLVSYRFEITKPTLIWAPLKIKKHRLQVC